MTAVHPTTSDANNAYNASAANNNHLGNSESPPLNNQPKVIPVLELLDQLTNRALSCLASLPEKIRAFGTENKEQLIRGLQLLACTVIVVTFASDILSFTFSVLSVGVAFFLALGKVSIYVGLILFVTNSLHQQQAY
jgi:hypothetical protein